MQTLDQLQKDAYDAGKGAGSWVFDGNSSPEYCAFVLKGYVDGDPEVMDMCPSPLSGEWADSPTPTPQTLQNDYDVSHEDIDEACDRYEQAFQLGYWDEVCRYARHQLS